MGEENHREWREAVRDPDVVRAMLEDYRAGLTIDRRDEEADRAAGNRVRCPALVLWSTRDDLEDLYGDPVRIWRDWADDVHGHGIDSGHHMAEQAPSELTAALDVFCREPRPDRDESFVEALPSEAQLPSRSSVLSDRRKAAGPGSRGAQGEPGASG